MFNNKLSTSLFQSLSPKGRGIDYKVKTQDMRMLHYITMHSRAIGKIAPS